MPHPTIIIGPIMSDSLPKSFLRMQNMTIRDKTNGMYICVWMQWIHKLMYLLRLPGLSGIPPTLQPLHEEAGLAGEAWVSPRPQWQALAALWLHTEAILSKAARSDLSLDEICSSDIPDTWKDWMNAKQSKVNAQTPSDTFRQVLTDYLASLPSSTGEVGGSIMKQVWCQPGKMGIFGLLLCLYWQAEYAGAGDDWDKNLKCVENIFNAILSNPGL